MTSRTRSVQIGAVSGRLGALAMVMALTACGGEGGPMTPPVTNPPAPVRTVIGNFTFALGPIEMAAPVEITVSGTGTGTVDATAQWTFASNDIDLYLTDRNCTATSFFSINDCNILARAESVTNKPEVINRSLAAGVYRVYVNNFGPGSEAGTLVIGFTR